jgi:hypothetical protein
MSRSPRVLALSALFVAAACGGGQATTAPTAQPTIAPTTAPTAQPTIAPTAEPTAAPTTPAEPTPTTAASLDPTQSDAGIAATVTITSDSRGGRDGTHEIYGVAADGSECNGSFEEPEFIVVAWYDDAPDGMIHRFGITVAADDIPEADGTTADITDGSVSFDFVSASGFGTTYTGAATRDNEGSSTIAVTRSGPALTFDFEGVTYDNVSFAGQFVCAGS